jgi:FtsP/CotA-like multicopper oxidase with cupredoxin domain
MALCCLAAGGAMPSIAANDNRAPAGRFESGVLTLHLELREGVWHPHAQDGRAIAIYSFAEEGRDPQTPGPLIRVAQGTELRLAVHNLLSSAAVVHGLNQHPGDANNVMQLERGETKEAHFAAGEPGSYLYWASTAGGAVTNRRRRASAGGLETRRNEEGMMSGAFIVDARGAKADDRIFVIQVRAEHLFERSFDGVLSINGKSWPYTHARLGTPEHWRIVNATPFEHPMHLRGFYFHVDAVSDGETAHNYGAEERRTAVTEVV